MPFSDVSGLETFFGEEATGLVNIHRDFEKLESAFSCLAESFSYHQGLPNSNPDVSGRIQHLESLVELRLSALEQEKSAKEEPSELVSEALISCRNMAIWTALSFSAFFIYRMGHSCNWW